MQLEADIGTLKFKVRRISLKEKWRILHSWPAGGGRDSIRGGGGGGGGIVEVGGAEKSEWAIAVCMMFNFA